MNNFKICEFCNKEYINLYIRNNKSKNIYTKSTRFCSKSCATKSLIGTPTKECLENEILEFIKKSNKYCTLKEILLGIKRSSRSLTKYKISTLDLNNSLGFVKTNTNFSNSVFKIISDNYDNIICEYTDDILLSPKGFKLRIDFYIPSENLMIEVDGCQHNDKNHKWYSEYYKKCDEIKNQYCLDNNIKLVRIPYKQNITKEYILELIHNSF